LYMVAEGGNTALRIVKELHEETQDPKFHTVQCLFEPWVNESETLIAHLVENDSRGELIFIDRARAAHELRILLEQETGTSLSNRDLAMRLRARGYPVDHASLAKMDYAIETLFPCIPMAFRAGLGLSQVERIRTLENILVAFLKDRKLEGGAVDEARRWLLGCLARYDSANLALTLEPIQREIEAHAAELCDESVAKVRADFGFIEATGRPGHDAPPPEPFKLREREVSMHPDVPGQTTDTSPQPSERVPGTTAGSSRSAVVSDTNTEVGDSGEPDLEAFPDHRAFDEAFGHDGERTNEDAEQPPLTRSGAPLVAVRKKNDRPQDVKSLRGRMWTLATQLAQRHGLSNCVCLCPKGCGFIVDLPDQPLYMGEHPASAEEAQRVTLWWMLAALSDEWPYGIDQAPALGYLEDASIYPAIRAVSEGDERTATETLMPRVSFPPSLDLAARQLFAVLNEHDYTRLIQLLDTRRALQGHCRRLGKRIVWEI
ncbi:MAG: ParB family protein, partial [Gammaproteobacteria bacterium]